MDMIVCTVDLSAITQPLVTWAACLTRRLSAELCLFHAVHTASDSLHPTTEFERGGELKRRREDARGKLQTYLDALAPLDPPCRLEVVFGDPAETLHRFCSHHPVDLVIAGSRGVKGIKRLFVGTVVERMVRMIGCPVLALHPNVGQKVTIDSIGVSCDTADTAASLIKPAFTLAEAFNASVDLLHSMASALGPGAREPEDIPYTQAQQNLQRQVRRQLEASAARQGHDAVAVRAHVGSGASQDLIPELARKLKVDILVVGVRRHSAIGKWVIGSTTEAVLRKASCHILTVPV